MTLADWPQLLILLLYVLNLAIAFHKDGQPKNEKHSFKVTFVGTCISGAILYAGGFWH